MHRIGIVALASVIGGSALAADMTRPHLASAAMAPRAVFDRSAFSIGTKGGIRVGRGDIDSGGPVLLAFDDHPSGAPGGLAAGNPQIGSFVYGLAADFEFAGITGSIAPACPAALCGAALGAPDDPVSQWSGSMRSRIGNAAGWFLYVSSGYAYARFDTNAIASPGGIGATFNAPDARRNWSTGGSAKIEYLDLDFGDPHSKIPFGTSPAVPPMNRW